ncbi:MAG: GIN domain-containing protein [Chloroflexota bacterium]
MNESRNRSGLVWGVLLILIGVLMFAGQTLRWLNWGEAWPLFIVGVGAAFFVAMLLGGRSAAGLAIPGSIISTVGTILLVQNIFNVWEAWSYAWALIIVAVGVGVTIQGIWSRQPKLRRDGIDTIRTGLTLFLIFGIIMEFIFSVSGVSGRGYSLVWPILLGLLGLLQLLTNLVRILREPDQAYRYGLFGPILLMGIGALAALAMMNVIPGMQLLALLNLWPLLLIAAGVQIIFGKRAAWAGALMGILVVAALFAAAFFGPQLGIDHLPTWASINGPYNSLANETIIGSGTQGEESREVEGFERIRLEGVGKLIVEQGEKISLDILADENLLPYLTSDVRAEELVLGVKRGYNVQPRQGIEYRLVVTDLSALYLDGAGNIVVKALDTKSLKIVVAGAGGITLEALQSKRLAIEIDGSGWVRAAGQSDELESAINGAGNLEAEDLECRQAELNISGLGKITAWVTGSLSARISGAGSIAYYGHPDVEKRVDGVGSVQSLGEK